MSITFNKILYILFFGEIILGGGGHLFDFLGISLRGIIFLSIWIFTIINVSFKLKNPNFKLKYKFFIYSGWILFLSFIMFLFSGIVIGLINGNSLRYIIEESNSFFFLTIAAPFLFFLDYENWSLEFLIIPIIIFSFILSILSNIFYFLMLFNRSLIPSINLYAINKLGPMLGSKIYAGLMPDGGLRFFFSNSYFVLASWFLIIPFLLSFKFPNTRKKFFYFSISISYFITIIASYSRSFFLTILIFSILEIFYMKKFKDLKKFFFYFLLIFILFFLISPEILMNIIKRFFGMLNFLGISKSKDISISIKLDQFKILFSEFLSSPFFGKGFGYVIPNYIRSISAPYSYELDLINLLVKTGIFGFIIWFSFLFFLLIRTKISLACFKNEVFYKGVILSSIFIIFSLIINSLSNPFFSSSVGMSLIILSTLIIFRFDINLYNI